MVVVGIALFQITGQMITSEWIEDGETVCVVSTVCAQKLMDRSTLERRAFNGNAFADRVKCMFVYERLGCKMYIK